LVELSERFYFKPLLPLITRNNHFYLLALAQNEIRLFQGNDYNINELALPEDVPSSLAEALRYDEPEKQFQGHSVNNNQSLIFHGQGVGTTDNKNQILRYFQKVDRGLHSILAEQQAPLILAGVEYLLPIYQQANSYAHLLSEAITGNPENLSLEELHQQATQVIQPYFHQARKEASANYQELVTISQASAQLKQIIPATYHGQVDTLFIAQDGKQYWGKFEPETNRIQLEDSSIKENFDLLNFAAIHTFLQGGMVYLMPTEEMPAAESFAAIFRYPVSFVSA
jgi:hypothetical protein